MIGTTIGPYHVVSKLGEGGMGEVYRAHDTKLNRDVAIKVLPDVFAGDAGRLARFTREAQTLAAVDHPNIAHVHGLEESNGVTALVMELVEGEDLSQRLARGPIPLDDVLPIAKQIAEALEAAHEQGVIHRDLKPANIKLRPDGTVKVLDFGLAKAVDPSGATSIGTAKDSPTITSSAMTRAGMILGTAAYMAPEQARGRVVDRRADIWAFGVVVFEMLTGRRAFPGDDITDTIVSVVSKEPDWGALPAVPQSLRRLLARCLKKDPKARLRDIGDARVQIDELLSGATEEVALAAPGVGTLPLRQSRSASSQLLPWMVAAAMTTLAITALMLWSPWRAVSASTTSDGLRLTPLSFEHGGQTAAVWSPDGKAVAFGARQKEVDPYQIYVRYLDSPVATQITRLDRSVTPIAWTSAGKIVFSAAGELWSVSPVGGEPEPWGWGTSGANNVKLQVLGAGSVSPDGMTAAALARGADGVISVWFISPPGSAPKAYEPLPITARSSFNTPSMKFSPDGRQIFLVRNDGAGEEAWLLPYPPSATNPPRRILHGIANFTGSPTVSWMPDNRHVVMSGSTSEAARQLYLADTVSESLTVLSSGTRAQNAPAVSPDGSKLVFVESETNTDVVSLDLATLMITPVIATQRGEQTPAWASRESVMVYATDRNGTNEIWLHRPGQPARPVLTARDFPTHDARGFMGPSLSPDGERVISTRLHVREPASLWMSAVTGGSPVLLVKRSGTERQYPGSWSPDGKWYVYRNFEEGRESLNKVKTTGQAEPEMLKPDVKRAVGWVPVWSPSGDWIMYEDAGVKLISPDGKTTRDISSASGIAYTFSADGQTIYGVRQPVPFGRVELFSIGVADGREKIIGSVAPEYRPASTLNPVLRLALAPDGKSLTFSTLKTTSNLWLMDGLQSVIAR